MTEKWNLWAATESRVEIATELSSTNKTLTDLSNRCAADWDIALLLSKTLCTPLLRWCIKKKKKQTFLQRLPDFFEPRIFFCKTFFLIFCEISYRVPSFYLFIFDKMLKKTKSWNLMINMFRYISLYLNENLLIKRSMTLRSPRRYHRPTVLCNFFHQIIISLLLVT